MLFSRAVYKEYLENRINIIKKSIFHRDYRKIFLKFQILIDFYPDTQSFADMWWVR